MIMQRKKRRVADEKIGTTGQGMQKYEEGTSTTTQACTYTETSQLVAKSYIPGVAIYQADASRPPHHYALEQMIDDDPCSNKGALNNWVCGVKRWVGVGWLFVDDDTWGLA